MLHLARLDPTPAEASPAGPSSDADGGFDQLLAQAEHFHRSGRQRFALLAIEQLAEMVGHEDGPSLEMLLQLIRLRKRVVLAMQAR
jgi:hypothetical protein